MKLPKFALNPKFCFWLGDFELPQVTNCVTDSTTAGFEGAQLKRKKKRQIKNKQTKTLPGFTMDIKYLGYQPTLTIHLYFA